MQSKSTAADRKPVAYLTITQFAEEVMVSTRTVRHWLADGELHAHQLGRQWRIAREDANAFMAVRRK
jgi:excisionase family DNA binding protein